MRYTVGWTTPKKHIGHDHSQLAIYRINTPKHSGKIHVFGDEVLRDRIVALLNAAEVGN